MSSYQYNDLKRQLLPSVIVCASLVMIVACHAPPARLNAVTASTVGDFTKQDTSNQELTAPPLGMDAPKPLTAPPLGMQAGLTAPPLGMQTELELQSFQAFDSDQDLAWNLNELDAYLQHFSVEQNQGFVTQSVASQTIFDAKALMQAFDHNHSQKLELKEAQALHLSLLVQNQTAENELKPIIESATELLAHGTEVISHLSETLLPENPVIETVTPLVDATVETTREVVSGLVSGLNGESTADQNEAESSQKKKLLGLL